MSDTVIKISVRSLVEFILREGDIDNRKKAGKDTEAMQAGSRIHRKIQRQMGAGYRAEVPLKITVPAEDYEICVEGRADGIEEQDGTVVIDEIKGIYMDLEHLDGPVGVHLAQAKCYAYIYGRQQGLSHIAVRMTYVNLDTEFIKYFESEYEFPELEKWFGGLMEEYRKWADFQFEWRKIRKDSIHNIEFPFPYREGQKELASQVYRTMYQKKRLFIQAPTGVGKTISTVFPAVKAVGEELGDKIFYLTAKTITRTVANEAFSLLREQGLRYKTVIITAKEKMCACEEMECNPDHCPYAKGHYDRVNDAVYALLTKEDNFTREVLNAHAMEYEVCPFEFCLDVSTWCDGIICDYNYVFDPKVYLKRFFAEGIKGDYLFLIDEAHNLVERAREMYSAALIKEDFLEIKKVIKAVRPKVAKELDSCNKRLLSMKRECDTYRLLPDIGDFIIALMRLAAELEKFLEEWEQDEIRDQVFEFYMQVRDFLNIYDRVDENYEIYTEHMENGQFQLKLFCIHTAKNLKEFLDKGNSAVFFSATLLPLRYYVNLLSGDMNDYAVYASSTFRPEQRLLLVGSDVSSKYTRRGQAEYQRMASYIQKTIFHKKGNYLVFFPSYRMMESVYESFQSLNPDPGCICLLQQPNMREQEREEFLSQFTTGLDRTLVGFCVMGGIFSEGIDLKQEQLIGAIIVGTGLPQVCNEREILKQYYDEHQAQREGFSYAYLYPGMNKVLQAAGRVIRTDQDTGVILLLDDRFTQYQYKQLFPPEWAVHEHCTLHTIDQKLEDFWRGQEKY
ncbi:ATP-dependent DNA helicase [Diplocloster agilis]|uniref:ATP-dependent DNA helicase n=1 Tax=Diplocloster agilis TaxID=2850323 RepID=A0A949NFA3_9FIRM|nr:ATP-dependent DNA helicase [Diplocloster agilis]MBU9734913.1 ATP-dependent DNA helicase [Diplocloster agilis]